MSPDSPSVPLGKAELVSQPLWRSWGAVPSAVSLGSGGPGSQGWGTAPVPAAVERGGEKREEEEEAGWLPFCLGHTHTLLISNDGKGNTH